MFSRTWHGIVPIKMRAAFEQYDWDIDRETKIHVATVQSLVKRILFNEADIIPAVSDYDLIVKDGENRKRATKPIMARLPILSK